METQELIRVIHAERSKRAYFTRLEILEQSNHLLKARLYVSLDLFVQVYRNDQFDTTNFVLIHNQQRRYARDQLGGVWHRHTVDAPHLHDTSEDGRKAVGLPQFLDEVEVVLSALGLP